MINTILNIDAIDGMKLIPDKSIDMIFVDLPYGVTAHNKWDSIIPFEPMWEQFERGQVILYMHMGGGRTLYWIISLRTFVKQRKCG